MTDTDYNSSISVKDSTRRRLTRYGRKGDTFDKIINILMDSGGQTVFDRGTPDQTTNAVADGPQKTKTKEEKTNHEQRRRRRTEQIDARRHINGRD